MTKTCFMCAMYPMYVNKLAPYTDEFVPHLLFNNLPHQQIDISQQTPNLSYERAQVVINHVLNLSQNFFIKKYLLHAIKCINMKYFTIRTEWCTY